jgi:peptide/nickel transport system permease protein
MPRLRCAQRPLHGGGPALPVVIPVVQYIIKRLLLMIPSLIVISMFVFVLIQLPPGSFVDSLAMQLASHGQEVSAEVIRGMEARYGLDKPIYVQYWMWISGFPRGDFGASFLYFGKQTWDIVKVYLGWTVLLALTTELFILAVGIPIGIYSATHQYSMGDHLFTFIGFVGLSVPGFLLALIMMFVAYFVFGIQSVGGLFSDRYLDAPWSIGKLLDLLSHLWVPIVVLGLEGTAGTIRRMRGNLLDVLNMQYVATARAKGLQESVVIYKHAARNALAPIIMALGLWFPQLLSGATIVSVVLSLPTLGPVLLQALQMQDMFLAGTILLFQCMLLLIGNLLADIALAWIDPRVELE